MSVRSCLVVLAAVIACLLFAGAAHAATVDVVASQDAGTNAAVPTENTGTATLLGTDASPVVNAYFKFRMPADPISKATLVLTTGSPATIARDVRPASSAWDQATLNASNAPAATSPAFASFSQTMAGLASMDATSYFKTCAPNTDCSIVVTTTDRTKVSLKTRENASGKPTVTFETVVTGPQPAFPIRAAFVYPWYPETWTGNPATYTHYHPTSGFYNYDTDEDIVSAQVADLIYANVNAGIASWWGQGSKTDSRLQKFLTASHGTNLKWAPYFECEGNTGGGCPAGSPDPSAAQITSDLQYLKTKYAGDPSYLKVGGRPVVFVYNASANDQSCAIASKWAPLARAEGFYVVLKVFSGYRLCADQPDSWHQYAPTTRIDRQGAFSTAISPGFWKGNEATPRLARDLPTFNQNIRDMIASGAQWQLVVSYNEWGEGSQLEQSTELGTAYLDALHNNGADTPPSTDADGDGLTGINDACPLEAGPASNNGCPVTTPPSDTRTILAAGDVQGEVATNPTTPILDREVAATDAVLALGDLQYQNGSIDKFQQWWTGNWGKVPAAKMLPIPGNHEHIVGNLAANYCTYMQGRTAFDTCANSNLFPYWSTNIGAWHVAALDTGTSTGNFTAEQRTWLAGDLAADTHTCQMVIFHHPRYSIGQHGDAASLQDEWQLVMDHHVDVVLTGHDHEYQRYGHMNATGGVDPAGPREFVVGTGGKNHTTFVNTTHAGLEASNSTTFGLLQMKLNPTGYDWRFLPEAGKTFSDTGSDVCH